MDVSNSATNLRVRHSKRFYALTLAGALLLVLCLAVLFIPVLDGPGSRRAAREASAVGTMRQLIDLEARYSTRDPAKGFACRLTELEKAATDINAGELNPFPATGERLGYKFSVRGCETSADGRIVRYQLVAVPVDPGNSGISVFCADETGVVWYDATGSAQACLTGHRPIY
ncbi:MAG TPA: hypothetical protein VMH48_09590 [Methylomirabilota bacterium]|nr:hypothetical protein [Methylomirabilota bacterium]